MGTDVWGPHGWKFFHYITLGYPDNPSNMDIKIYKNFFNLIGKVLPCSMCRDNYNKHIKENPLDMITMSNKNKFIKWGIKMHNIVNKELGKRIYTNSEVIDDIIMDKSCSSNGKLFFKGIIFIILILIIVFIYKKIM
jgi:hypothetical protein